MGTTTDTAAGTRASVSEPTDQMAMPSSSPLAFRSADPAALPLTRKICTSQILLVCPTQPALPVPTEVSATSCHTHSPLAASISPTKPLSAASRELKEIQKIATVPQPNPQLMTVTSAQNSSLQHLQCTRCQNIFRRFLRISSNLTSCDQTQTQLDHATLAYVLLLLSFLNQWPNFFHL